MPITVELELPTIAASDAISVLVLERLMLSSAICAFITETEALPALISLLIVASFDSDEAIAPSIKEISFSSCCILIW